MRKLHTHTQLAHRVLQRPGLKTATKGGRRKPILILEGRRSDLAKLPRPGFPHKHRWHYFHPKFPSSTFQFVELAMLPKKKITAPAPEAEEQTPAEPVQEQATPTPVADESDVPSDQKHQAATEGKRGNASSPFDLVKSKKSKAKSPSKYKECKKCYVSFSNDRNMPNAIHAEADAQDATRVEAIDMICPGEPDLYFVAIGDDNVVRVFHSWSALKNYYILDKVPFFTKLCDDKREL
eukprot:g62827.t1